VPKDDAAKNVVVRQPRPEWTVNTLHDYLLKLMDAADVLEKQRFEAERIARDSLDLRYEQRFSDNKLAIDAALSAAKEAVAAALLAADRAVTKAEDASAKRFECVAADTPILCANLVWRNAGDLQVGDKLLAFDEEKDAAGERQLRCATVTYHDLQTDALFTVETPHGSIRCNAQHPWLVYRQDGVSQWIKTRDLQVGDRVTLVNGEWHQPRTRGPSDFGSFDFAEEIPEIDLLALNLNLGVPLAVLPERDASIGGSRSSIAGLVLGVGATRLRELTEIGAAAVETVPVDMVGLEGVTVSQSENQAVQPYMNSSPVDMIACHGIPVAQAPAVAADKVNISSVDHGLPLDHMAIATQGDQCSSVVLEDRLAALTTAGSVATAGTVFAATILNLGDASQEADSALLADAGDEGTFRSIMSWHLETSFSWCHAPGASTRRGTLLPLLYPVTSIKPVGMGRIASMSTSTRTYIAGGWAMHNSVNEFRAALTDQSNNMIPRTEAEQRFKSLSDKMDIMMSTIDGRLTRTEKFQSERVGAMGQSESSKGQSNWLIGLACTIILAVAAIVVSVILAQRHP
jgi:hypothetical protein